MGVRVSGDTVFATMWHYRDPVGLASESWLVALDRATGRELWNVVLPSFTGGTCVWGAPSFFGNLVIFAEVGGRTWAIDRTTRTVAWRFTPPIRFAALAQSEVAGNRVFVSAGDESIYALDASSGTIVWRTATPIATTDLLVTERGVYYSWGARLRALDRATGRPLAEVRVSPSSDAVETPAAADERGRIYIAFTRYALSFNEP